MGFISPAVRHGDLWYGNLLTQEDGAISAVLDWEMVAIADPERIRHQVFGEPIH